MDATQIKINKIVISIHLMKNQKLMFFTLQIKMKLNVSVHSKTLGSELKYVIYIDSVRDDITIDDNIYSINPQLNRKKRLLEYIYYLESGQDKTLCRVLAFVKLKFKKEITNKIMALLIYDAILADHGAQFNEQGQNKLIPKSKIVSININKDVLIIENKTYFVDLELLMETNWNNLSIDMLSTNQMELNDDTDSHI